MTNGTRLPEAIIIGAAIADVLLCPVDEMVFAKGSLPVDSIRMRIGGDAVNEATVLARLGHAPVLATVLGDDGVADFVEAHCLREGIALHAKRRAGMDTGINAVLVGPTGERSFITNRNGSLRKLSMEDVLPLFETEAFRQARLVCLASMFVSPMLTLADMEEIFLRAKLAGKIVCADSTKRKNGETLADAAGALSHLDYFMPNLDEARLLTGLEKPDDVADALLGVGVKNVALKLGGSGCLLKNGSERHMIPVWPVERCLDTTGAGDTFAAALQAAILEGRSLAECGAYANAAASICVEQLGATTAALERREIDRRIKYILSNV